MTVSQQIAALGFDPSYSGRAKLYGDLGLGGGFSGSASQNIALLNALNNGRRPGGAAPGAPVDTRTEMQRFAEDTARQRQEQINRQNSEQEGLFGRYESAVKSQEKPSAAYSRLREAAGIPQLQEQINIFKGQIYNTKDLLDRLNEDINSRVSGSFTTEAQARRMEAKEGSDLNTQLGRLGTGLQPLVEQLTGAQGEVGTQLGFLQQEQQTELDPIRMRISSLSDRFAREISGFDSNKELEFNALADKINEGRRLEQREWERMQQLATESRAYARQKQQLADQLAQQKSLLSLMGQTTPQTSPSAALAANGGMDYLGSLGSTNARVQYLRSLGMSPQEIQESMGSFNEPINRFQQQAVKAGNTGWVGQNSWLGRLFR